MLLLIIVLFSFKNTGEKSYLVTGRIDSYKGKVVYLKKYDHFNYLDRNFILDSCLVDSLGSFSFELKKEYPKLIKLETHKYRPLSYQVFEDSPEIFYYSMCENFLAETPTFYIEDHKSYIIQHWDNERRLNSVVFGDTKSNQLREYYKTVDFRKDLRDENRRRINTNKEEALQSTIKYRDYFLNKYSLNQSFPDNSFNQYFRTEIYLGALNEFLQWYSADSQKSIDDLFYQNLMANYKKEIWHPNSLEYYKFNEHYITYLMNLDKNSLEKYFPPSNKKIEIAEQNSNSNIKNIYIKNLRELINK